MAKYRVYIFTDSFKEAVNAVVSSKLIEITEGAPDTMIEGAGGYASALERGRKCIHGIFGLHWVGATRRSIPKEVFDLDATEHLIESDKFEVVDGGHKVPVINWKGVDMHIHNIPDLAYAEEVVDAKSKTQKYYLVDQEIEGFNCSTQLEAMQLIAEKLAKGESPIGGSIQLNREDPPDDI